MKASVKTACGGYGAFELKSTYQRNMMLGTISAALMVATIVFGFYIYQHLRPDREIPEPEKIVIKSVFDLPAPPLIKRPKPKIDVAPASKVKSKIGIPKPIKDDEIDEDVVIFSKEEIQEYIIDQSPPIDLTVTPIIIDSNIIDDEIVQPEFKPVEIQAQMIYEHLPEYPRLARQAGLQAVLWVAALVDENGDVKDAMIYKSSDSKAGFDEAALDAAYKCKFKPAIQNNRPVESWVVYQVAFELTSSR